MGSGGEHGGDVSGSSQRFFRHRRRPSTVVDTGLDHPPSVASPRGQPHSLRIQTSQYLCTLIHPSLANSEEAVPAGTAPCGPIVAFGRYVVSATNDGRVCFYSVKVDSDLTLPESVVELDPFSTLIGLVATPAGISLVQYRSTVRKNLLLKPPDLLGHLVAISSEGDVHLLECTTQNVKKMYSWNTGTCNVSCVTVRPDRNGQWRISLGYESGCLEEWQVSIPVRETKRDETGQVENNNEEEISKNDVTRESDWKPLMRRVFPQLLWRGSFDMPIRSISSLGTVKTGHEEPKNQLIESRATAHGSNKTDATISQSQVNSKVDDVLKDNELLFSERGDENNRSEDAVNETGDFLALCLVRNPHTDGSSGQLASSSLIEVIHVARLEGDWMPQEQVAALPLEEYCVWPTVEILDTASLTVNDSQGQRRLSRRIRGLPSRGSDCMCKFYTRLTI